MDYSFFIGIHRNYVPRYYPSTPDTKSTIGIPQSSVRPLRNLDGGIVSADDSELYFCTIIDFFQEWNLTKKMENSLKSLVIESSSLSAIPPAEYRERFLKFMNEIIQ